MNPLYSNTDLLFNECMKLPDNVVMDCGANEGGYTNTMLQWKREVHLFEPVPDMFLECQQKFANNPNVYMNNVGLSDKKDYLTDVTVHGAWVIGKDLGMEVVPQYRGIKFDMALITLDSYVEVMNIPKVGFIKLDVDGYELKVLKGAINTIKRDYPPILLELSEYPAKLGDSIEDFINFIFFLGYHIWSMDGKNVFKTWEEVKPYYPYHSSFDVFLKKAE